MVNAAQAAYEKWAAPKLAAAEAAAKKHFDAGEQKQGVAVLTALAVEASKVRYSEGSSLVYSKCRYKVVVYGVQYLNAHISPWL